MKKDISGIETEIIVKKVKNISIKIKENGEVVLTVPQNRSIAEAEKFFLSKLNWIIKHKNESSDFVRCEVCDNGRIFLFGEEVTLKFTESSNNAAFLNGDKLYVFFNGKKLPKRILEEYLKIKLNEKLKETFEKWEKITGLYSSSVSIRKTTSKWGSCTPKTKRIRMSLYLACLPLPCAEYVTLHELLHLKYPDHGKRFHNALDYYMPQWKKIRKFMRENGGKMRIGL